MLYLIRDTFGGASVIAAGTEENHNTACEEKSLAGEIWTQYQAEVRKERAKLRAVQERLTATEKELNRYRDELRNLKGRNWEGIPVKRPQGDLERLKQSLHGTMGRAGREHLARLEAAKQANGYKAMLDETTAYCAWLQQELMLSYANIGYMNLMSQEEILRMLKEEDGKNVQE